MYQISFKSKKLFVDGRTYGRTDIFPPILLGRLLEVDLKIKFIIYRTRFLKFGTLRKSNRLTSDSPTGLYISNNMASRVLSLVF